MRQKVVCDPFKKSALRVNIISIFNIQIMQSISTHSSFCSLIQSQMIQDNKIMCNSDSKIIFRFTQLLVNQSNHLIPTQFRNLIGTVTFIIQCKHVTYTLQIRNEYFQGCQRIKGHVNLLCHTDIFNHKF